MKVLMFPQLSPEWWVEKVGSIGGSRFGQVISTKKTGCYTNLSMKS